MRKNQNSRSQTSSRKPAAQNFRGARPDSRPQRTDSRPQRSENRPQRSSEPRYEFVPVPREWRTITGTHAVNEVVQVRPKTIQMAWLKQGWESSLELKDLAKELKSKNVKIEAKPAGFLDKFAAANQGAILFSSDRPVLDWQALEQAPKAKVMILDGIEDPHNLGAILRTGWLMGVDGVLIPEDRSVGLTSTVHKVACGGAEHVPVESYVNFSNPVEDLKKKGFWVFGLSHLGERSLFDLQIPEKIVWCVGSEDKGLRSTTERLCDELVQIPQASAAASYNASVAAAIALTETVRVHSHKKL